MGVLDHCIHCGCDLHANLFLAIHECSHNLLFKKRQHNEMYGIFMNLPIALPYSTKFKLYHIEHHKLQGVDGIDTDVPTKLELLLFNNVLGKLFFAICQILFYAIRPMAVRQQIVNDVTIKNFVAQFSFNALVVYFFGLGPIYYLLASDFLSDLCTLVPRTSSPSIMCSLVTQRRTHTMAH